LEASSDISQADKNAIVNVKDSKAESDSDSKEKKKVKKREQVKAKAAYEKCFPVV